MANELSAKKGVIDKTFDRREIETEFMRVCSKLTYESSPFYASVLMQCARVYSFKIPTLAVAVTQQVLLIVNPDFFMGRVKAIDTKTKKEVLLGCQNLQERIACIEHELLHLVFYHLSRGSKHSDHKTSNIAADMVCNQYVRFKLPGDPIRHEAYQLPGEKDMDWYYKELKKQQSEGSKNGSDPKGQKGQKGQKGPPSQGGEGDGDGEGEGEEDPHATPKNARGTHESWDENKERKEDGSGSGNQTLDDIGIEDGGLAESAREAIACDVVRQAASKEGKDGLSKLPGAVAAHIEEMLKPKKGTQPWNTILQRFVGTHGSSILKQSRKYCSRRYKDPLTGRKARPGLRIKRQKKILVAIDTSGSMRTEDLELLAGELSLISRYNPDVTVIECDTQIHRQYKFRGELKSVCGRGGTDMWPVRKAFEEGPYDCCICMTDGFVGDIGERGPRKGWLWLITSGGEEPCKWGMFIHLPDAATVS